jgi:hypothetical protein
MPNYRGIKPRSCAPATVWFPGFPRAGLDKRSAGRQAGDVAGEFQQVKLWLRPGTVVTQSINAE